MTWQQLHQDIGDKVITTKKKVVHKSQIQRPKLFSSPQKKDDERNEAIPSCSYADNDRNIDNENQLIIKNHISTIEQNFDKRIIDLTTSLKAHANLNTLHTSVIAASELKQIIANLTVLYGESRIANFGNLKYYYQLAEDLFEIFRLIPVPIQNTIFIPNLPYLIIGTDLQQYEEEACPMIQDFYICQNHLSPQLNDCVVALIKKAEIQNCEAVQVNVTMPIGQPITNKYILAIPTLTNLKVQKLCQNNEIAFINHPSLIEIPLNCGIITGNIRIWNKEETIDGRPLSLPPIKIETMTSPIANQKILKLNSVDLDKIKDLQKQSELLMPIKHEAIHPATWSIATICTTLLFIVIALTVIWQLYKRRGTQLRELIQGRIIQTSENSPQSVLFSTSAGGVI
ncbi:unnamed protein product [Ceutorhynchus assimilis]|uniref:Uncharacterized protein n=1 Tax=Ceutorhynchus assimilis TaxID=467358 RepID=A0A9N9QFJ9_9CUCU|nr:unnamed protein product [Ceutorhynchus assimilis]